MAISLRKTLKYTSTLCMVFSLSSELLNGLVHEVLGHGLAAYALGGSFDGYTLSQAYTVLPPQAPFSSHLLHRAAGVLVSVSIGLPLFVVGYRAAPSKWYGLALMIVGSVLVIDNLYYVFANAVFPRPPGDFGWILTQWEARGIPGYSIVRYACMLSAGLAFYIVLYLTCARVYRQVPHKITLREQPPRSAYHLVAVLLLIASAVSVYTFDYNSVISQVGSAPNHILFGSIALIVVFLTIRLCLGRVGQARAFNIADSQPGENLLIVRSVFWLLWLIALILQMHWRVVGLATLLMLAVMVIPKHRHHYFWSAVGIFGLIFLIWVLLPISQDGWSPYDFEGAQATAQQNEIQNGENAAVLYDKVHEDLWNDPNRAEYGELNHTFWLAEDLPDVARWFADAEPWIDLLHEASLKKHCEPEYDPNQGIRSPIDEMGSRVRRLCYFLICSANHELAEGRLDRALNQYAMVVRMSHHLFIQNSTITWLTGISLRSWLFNRIKTGILQDYIPLERALPLIELIGEHHYVWQDQALSVARGYPADIKHTYSQIYQRHHTGRVIVYTIRPRPQ